jgi:hypothetical protein
MRAVVTMIPVVAVWMSLARNQVGLSIAGGLLVLLPGVRESWAFTGAPGPPVSVIMV